MTIKNGNAPASPLSGDAYQDYAGYDETNKTSYNPQCQGLTKREHFAAMAMQGLLSNSGGPIQANNQSGTGWCNCDASMMSKLAIECADELLKELAK